MTIVPNQDVDDIFDDSDDHKSVDVTRSVNGGIGGE